MVLKEHELTTTELFANLGDEYWCLNNLFTITDKRGKRIPFKMNWAQDIFYHGMHTNNVVLKARQLGISTFSLIFFLNACLFHKDTKCGVISHTMKAGMEIFAKVKLAYECLPDLVKKICGGVVNDNKQEIHFGNGSSITVGTSHRGGTLQYLLVSEIGKIAARAPGKAEEIMSGAVPTVAPGGIIIWESTAEGQKGLFFDKVKIARLKQARDEELTILDDKFFFFPWYEDPTYTIKGKAEIPEDLDKYFTHLDEDRGIKLTPGQKLWYAKTAESMGENMQREYPSHPDEAFAAAIKGSYFAGEIAKLEKLGKIGEAAYDPRLKVETSWDIGVRDPAAIWARQVLPTGGYRYINYYENNNKGLQHYIGVLEQWSEDYGYKYSRHLFPHDGAKREFTSGDNPKTIAQLAQENGLKNVVVLPNTRLAAGIQAVRDILPLCSFDQKNCAVGIMALKNYRRSFNEKMEQFTDTPVHDQYSHGTDAFRMSAISKPIHDEDDTGFNMEIKVPKFGAV